MPRAARINRPADGAQTISVTLPANGATPAAVEEAKPLDFWEACAAVPASAWGTDYLIYVYRDWPATPGMKGYLTKLTAPIDRDEFAQQFGGFQYRLMLNKNGKMIAVVKHEVALPPKAVGTFDPGMLGANGIGMPSIGADQSALIQFADIIRQQVEKQNPADKNTVELLMSASKNAMEIMRSQTPNPFEMFRTMMEMQRQTAAPENSMVTTMMTMMTAIMSKLMEKSLAPENTFSSQLKAFREISETLQMNNGGGHSRGPDLGTMLISKLPDIAQAAGSLMSKYAVIAEHNRKAAEANAYARANSPITVPAQPVATAPQPAPVPVAAPTPVAFAPFEREPMNSMNTTMEEDAAMFDRLKQKLVQNILMGVPAESIVDYISIENPMLMSVLRNASKTELKEFFSKDAILSQALNYPKFDEFIDDAVEYMAENRAESKGPGVN